MEVSREEVVARARRTENNLNVKLSEFSRFTSSVKRQYDATYKGESKSFDHAALRTEAGVFEKDIDLLFEEVGVLVSFGVVG